ncbi:GTP-binding protein [Halomonas cupida]|uniref:GTP-binding protein n=1 Tax=Halomonas cupida TaxID=44933 RepID=UPI003A953F42
MVATERHLPVTVIAGFLGAGKTSYLNQCIAGGQVDDALIIVNDVGTVNVDVESIAWRDDRVLALTNGCMCCTLGGSLVEQLSQALRLKSRPAQVIIEASGVADPERIADIARLAPGMELAEVVVLVDASQARHLAGDVQVGQLWQAQLAAAHRVLINRLPPGQAQQAVLQWLSDQAPDAAMECQPDIDSAEQQESAWHEAPAAGRDQGPRFMTRVSSSSTLTPSAVPGHAGLAHGLCHRAVRFSEPVPMEELEALLLDHLDVLLRAKGFVLICSNDRVDSNDHAGWFSLQLSGPRLVWRAHAASANGSTLVCIGRGGARFDQLIQQLQGLVTSEGNSFSTPVSRVSM